MDFIKATLSNVNEFHTVFGHDIDVLPTDTLRTLRIALIAEERQELEAAIKEQDAVGIVDALADLAYVIGGTIIALDGEKQSADPSNVHLILSSMLVSGTGRTFTEDLIALIGFIKDLEKMIANEDMPIIDVICTFSCVLLQKIAFLANMVDIDPIAMVAEAHRSNMTKLWSDDVVLRNEQITSDPARFSDIAFKVRPDLEDGLVGYRLSDGKILKCPSYSDADFSPFVSEVMTTYLEN